MKHTFLTLTAIVASATMQAQQSNDTIRFSNPRSVEIISGDSLQTIKVYGKEGDPDYTYQSTIQLVDSNYVGKTDINRDSWDFTVPFIKKKKHEQRYDYEDRGLELTTHLGLGLCATDVSNPADMHTSVGSSWEIFWTILEWKREYRHSKWTVGFGIDWRNYRMTNRQRFLKDTDSNVLVAGYPDNAIPDFSRLKVFSLQVPALYHYPFSRKYSIGVGPVVNFNTHSSLKTRYKDADGRKQKDTANNVHANAVTVDIMAVAHTPLVNFYFKYSPCEVLNTTYSPKFRSISFGVYL